MQSGCKMGASFLSAVSEMAAGLKIARLSVTSRPAVLEITSACPSLATQKDPSLCGLLGVSQFFLDLWLEVLE